MNKNFVKLLADIGDQQALNTLREAGEIMQAVWENQEKTGHETNYSFALQRFNMSTMVVVLISGNFAFKVAKLAWRIFFESIEYDSTCAGVPSFLPVEASRRYRMPHRT
ncbi:hypothetical protein AUP68_11085 [Ilyonectria robusta]